MFISFIIYGTEGKSKKKKVKNTHHPQNQSTTGSMAAGTRKRKGTDSGCILDS